MTKKEVANLLKVDPVTIDRYCKQKKIAYYQIGKRKKFLKADIDKYLEGAKRHATEENSDNPFNTN